MSRNLSTQELRHQRKVRDLMALADRAAALLHRAGNVHMPFPASDADRMRCLDAADAILACIEGVRNSGPALGRRGD